jgi:hypothetical protein
MGKTDSESKNIEETYADNSVQLRRPMSSGIIGVTDGLIYLPSEFNSSSVAPTGLIFSTTGVSSGLFSSIRASGITNFTAYNPYIHYSPLGGLNSTMLEAANNAGVSSTIRINVMETLVFASQRYEIYSRKFRGQL